MRVCNSRPPASRPMKTPPLLTFAGLALACLQLSAHAQTIVDFGTAATFAVLGASTVTNTGLTVVTGHLGTSPGTAITGFGPGVVHGTIYSAGAVALQAQADALTAYSSLASQTATTTTGAAATFANTTLSSGVYQAPTSLGLSGTLTLDGGGNPNATFVFQTGSTLISTSGSQVVLINGARAANVYWQVGSSATLGTYTSIVGSLFAHDSVTANTGASVTGRLIALNAAVTLDSNTISLPASAIPEPATTALLVAGCALALAVWCRHRTVRTALRNNATSPAQPHSPEALSRDT